MSDPSAPPGWFGILREDIAGLRAEFSARLDRLVTQDAFAAEQRRVDDKFADLGSDIVTEREARMADAQALRKQIDDVDDKAEAASKAAASRRTWWFRLVVGGIVTAILGTFGTLLALYIQAASHLNGGAP